jgi:hypothetical protein
MRAIFAWERRMTNPLRVVLWVGVLLLAGCGNVRTQPQDERMMAAPPPEPAVEPGGLLGQERMLSGPTGAEPNGTETRPARAGGDKAAAVDPAGMAPAEAGRDVRSENVGRTGDTAAAKAELIEVRVPVPDKTREPNDAVTAIFTEYAEALKTCVREDGLVDYGGLRRRRLDLKPLLMKLGELDPNVYQRWPQDEKLAFWINAYNLKMLDIITRSYPIQSSWWLRLTWPPDDIRHIRGMWTDFRFVVMDEEFTLGEVERRFFHKTFDDPRVYLALTYACQSSPLLRRQPYRGDNLDRQLDEQVRQFLSSPHGLQIDRRNMVVRLSALLKPTWRGKEFVSRYGTDKKFKNQDAETRAVLSFITGYLPREDVYFLEVENYTIEYVNFDWRLNDTSKGY